MILHKAYEELHDLIGFEGPLNAIGYTHRTLLIFSNILNLSKKVIGVFVSRNKNNSTVKFVLKTLNNVWEQDLNQSYTVV